MPAANGRNGANLAIGSVGLIFWRDDCLERLLWAGTERLIVAISSATKNYGESPDGC